MAAACSVITQQTYLTPSFSLVFSIFLRSSVLPAIRRDAICFALFGPALGAKRIEISSGPPLTWSEKLTWTSFSIHLKYLPKLPFLGEKTPIIYTYIQDRVKQPSLLLRMSSLAYSPQCTCVIIQFLSMMSNSFPLPKFICLVIYTITEPNRTFLTFVLPF